MESDIIHAQQNNFMIYPSCKIDKNHILPTVFSSAVIMISREIHITTFFHFDLLRNVSLTIKDKSTYRPSILFYSMFVLYWEMLEGFAMCVYYLC